MGCGRSRPGPGPNADHAWFLAVAFPDNQTQILSYHRVVKDLAGRSPDAFVAEVKARFRTEPGGPTARRKGECSMYVAGRWYTIVLCEEGHAAPADPIRSLDVSILQDGVIEPLLAIADVRTDRRIDFVGGIRGTSTLERLVDEGKAAVAFSMFPVTVGELMAIADAGAIMPPKSTWFEPSPTRCRRRCRAPAMPWKPPARRAGGRGERSSWMLHP